MEGLQRALNVQRLIHNWVRPHGRFTQKKTTPAMAMGLIDRPLAIAEILTPMAAAAFIQQPYAPEAVLLRRWDDLAKEPQAPTPVLEHFI